MSTSQTFLTEFDAETAITRRLLERLPEDKLEWQPHEKSMTLGLLAGHLAELVGFGATICKTESLDFSKEEYKPTVVTSRQQVLRLFDEKTAEARAAIASVAEEDFAKEWWMDYEGQTIFKAPRVGVIRTMMLNHIIHHRGQFSVYLRLTGVPVPAIYGPSADESGM